MRQLKIATQITNRDSQAVEKYLQEISKIAMINPERETILAQKIKNLKEPIEGRKALEELVQANLRFVVSVAKQYQHQGLSLSDPGPNYLCHGSVVRRTPNRSSSGASC